MSTPTLSLGTTRPLDGAAESAPYALPAHHLVTHAVVTGMTGSGKTGLVTVLVEEALRAQVPVLLLDAKGDLTNLLFAFPTFDPAAFVPWLDAAALGREGTTVEAAAEALARTRRDQLLQAGVDEAALRAFDARVAVRVITPGGAAGESLDVLSALDGSAARGAQDDDAVRARISAALSLVLRLLGRDPDPARSREHVVLSLLAARRLRAGEPAGLGELLHDVLAPPITQVGAMSLDAFLPRTERRALAAALNALLASPTFASWQRGAPLDVGAWLAPTADGRTPATIVSVAHLDDAERMLVLGLVLQAVAAWVRAQPGTSALRALVVIDEAYGLLPPYPANPPTKPPLVALLKQARAFGVGLVVATQNPMDLDYRALGNAGLWCVGRLQTDADRARVVEGLVGSGDAVADGLDAHTLTDTIKRLAARWFVLRDAHGGPPRLLNVRTAMSWLRGPMVPSEIAAARQRTRGR